LNLPLGYEIHDHEGAVLYSTLYEAYSVTPRHQYAHDYERHHENRYEHYHEPCICLVLRCVSGSVRYFWKSVIRACL
jgi:hypothetical protein